jgi:hypothetical protein
MEGGSMEGDGYQDHNTGFSPHRKARACSLFLPGVTGPPLPMPLSYYLPSGGNSWEGWVTVWHGKLVDEALASCQSVLCGRVLMKVGWRETGDGIE